MHSGLASKIWFGNLSYIESIKYTYSIDTYSLYSRVK